MTSTDWRRAVARSVSGSSANADSGHLAAVLRALLAELPLSATSADVEETPDEVVVDLDLPGVRPDDVEVRVLPHEIRVHAMYRSRRRVGLLRHHTRPEGRLGYTVELTVEVEPRSASATLSRGVLTMHVARVRHP
jgi:HSP20 family protein